MSKISVTLDVEFETNKFLITNKESFETEFISGVLAKNYYSKVNMEKLSLYMETVDPDDINAGVSFEFPLSSVKPKSIFTIVPKDDFSGLKVKIQGELVLKLRAGVKEYFKPTQKLKIKGVAYLGGEYRGFMSYLLGQNDQNRSTWIEVEKYIIV
jgi:hypothetical protein